MAPRERQLIGDQGKDHLIGGAGNDFIRDGYDIVGAADDFVGGADIDTVSYLDSNLAISINLARQFNANATTGVIDACHCRRSGRIWRRGTGRSLVGH